MEGIEDATHKAQQRQRQGRTLDAIRLFEQALELRIDLHGPESSSVKKACDNLSDILNGAALKHLQCEEYEEAKKLLQKAEMLTGPDDLISAITYNNIACYYRRCCSFLSVFMYPVPDSESLKCRASHNYLCGPHTKKSRSTNIHVGMFAVRPLEDGRVPNGRGMVGARCYGGSGDINVLGTKGTVDDHQFYYCCSAVFVSLLADLKYVCLPCATGRTSSARHSSTSKRHSESK